MLTFKQISWLFGSQATSFPILFIVLWFFKKWFHYIDTFEANYSIHGHDGIISIFLNPLELLKNKDPFWRIVWDLNDRRIFASYSSKEALKEFYYLFFFLTSLNNIIFHPPIGRLKLDYFTQQKIWTRINLRFRDIRNISSVTGRLKCSVHHATFHEASSLLAFSTVL